MNDAIAKFIDESRERERFCADSARRQKAAIGDQRSLDSLHLAEGKSVLMEPRFREALAVLVPAASAILEEWTPQHLNFVSSSDVGTKLEAALHRISQILAGAPNEGSEKGEG